jgi:crossover junction endodeoxyribonuclease RusA
VTDNIIELDIPLAHGLPYLSANYRLHWSARAERVRIVREAVAWRAREHKLTPQSYLIVQLHYIAPDRRKRDPSNLMPNQKAGVDGLVQAGVVPDDTPEYVGELMPVIHEPAGSGPRMWLAVAIRVLRSSMPHLSAEDLDAIDEDHRHKLRADAATWTEENR